MARSLRPIASLTARLAPFDTIAELEAASRDRRRDADVLRGSGHRFWEIYTSGYVVEMLLKSAFFRLCGLAERDDTAWYLRHAEDWGAMIGVAPPGLGLHDILFWARLVVAERTTSGRSLKTGFASEMLAHAKTTALHWRAAMRYRQSARCFDHAQAVYSAVTWMRQNHSMMWN